MKEFKGVLPQDCGTWLASFLRQSWEESGGGSRMPSVWSNQCFAAKATVVTNDRGRVIQLVVEHASQNERKAVL